MRRNIELRNVLIRGEDKFQYGGRTDIFMSSNTNMGSDDYCYEAGKFAGDGSREKGGASRRWRLVIDLTRLHCHSTITINLTIITWQGSTVTIQFTTSVSYRPYKVQPALLYSHFTITIKLANITRYHNQHQTHRHVIDPKGITANKSPPHHHVLSLIHGITIPQRKTPPNPPTKILMLGEELRT